MTKFELCKATWRKSSRSGGSNNCVEVASIPSIVAVRDSKNPTGDHVVVTRGTFTRLLTDIKADKFTLA